MSGFKNFAVAGAGEIGSFIIEELLKLKAYGKISSVIVLTRGSSGNDTLSELAKLGAKVAVVDYASASSVTSALIGVDVVISTLAEVALPAQTPLAEAAKVAGVKLFAPSEFGLATEGITDGVHATKNAFHRTLEKIGLPFALFYTGAFSDFIFRPFFGWDIANGKVTIAGEGKVLISWTTRRDIATFVAYVLTSLPRDQLEWKEFPIEGDRKSMNEVVEGYQAKSGKTLQVSHTPRSDVEKALQENPNNFSAWLQLALDDGRGINGKPEDLANKLYPEWKPTSVVDAIFQPES